MSAATAHDDYAQVRVPTEARYPWWSVAIQRFGMLSAFGQFLLGATLGFGQSFWTAFWSITLGAVILEVVSIFLGIMGMREGMQTSMLSRWCGFGRAGSAIIGLAIGVSLIGWFGVQSGVAAAGLGALVPSVPVWVWSIVAGLGVTAICVYGFKSMAWTAYITVPIFLVLVGWAIVAELQRHSLSELVASAPAGPELTLLQGTTLVAGGFIVGAIISPDLTRYNRSAADVVKQTVISVSLGEYLIGLIGVLLAHAVRSADIITIVTSSVGWVGILITIVGVLKINDWNLYSSGLGVVNFAGTVFDRRVNRAVVTAVIGVVGSVAAAVGILGVFIPFLIVLGSVFPPIAGIFVAEYFVVKRWRADLEATRHGTDVPPVAPQWVPATLVIWLVSAVVGYFVTWGLPSINSLVVAFVLYVVAGKAGLVRGYGEGRTETYDAARPGGLTGDERQTVGA